MAWCTYPRNETLYTNNSPFTSYTTLTPHSDSRSDFPLRDVTKFNIRTYKIIATCIERYRATGSVFFFSGPLGGEISPPRFQISPQNNNTFNPIDTKLHIGMAQKRLTVYFSKASSSGTTQQAQCTVSDSEAQDSLECTLCTKTHCDSDSDSSSEWLSILFKLGVRKR